MGADNTFGEVNFNPEHILTLRPTCDFRYALRDIIGTNLATKVLMQAWECVDTGKIIWKEIEEVDEGELLTPARRDKT